MHMHDMYNCVCVHACVYKPGDFACRAVRRRAQSYRQSHRVGVCGVHGTAARGMCSFEVGDMDDECALRWLLTTVSHECTATWLIWIQGIHAHACATCTTCTCTCTCTVHVVGPVHTPNGTHAHALRRASGRPTVQGRTQTSCPLSVCPGSCDPVCPRWLFVVNLENVNRQVALIALLI